MFFFFSKFKAKQSLFSVQDPFERIYDLNSLIHFKINKTVSIRNNNLLQVFAVLE